MTPRSCWLFWCYGIVEGEGEEKMRKLVATGEPKVPHRTWMEMWSHNVVLGEVADPVVSIVLEHQRAISLVNILMFVQRHAKYSIDSICDKLIGFIFTACTKCWRFQLGIWCHTCYLNDFFHSKRWKRWKPKDKTVLYWHYIDWVQEIVLLKMWWGPQFSWLFRVYRGWNTTQLIWGI